jgi:perosamine synthetase
MPDIKFELESKFGSEYGADEEAAMLAVLRKNAPTSGDACIQFEHEFAGYCGTTHARAVSNGTAALFLALRALGVGPGDRVLTTPLTWIATAAAGATLGAEVDFVDVDPRTYNMDMAQVEAKLTPNTKAVLPVHLYGQCCDMDTLRALGARHGFAIVEDACHAPGATWNGEQAGSMGTFGCFSFHEQKNISTLGEGGMITCNDAGLFEQVSLYRSHCTRVYGASTKYCALDEAKRPMGRQFWFQDFDDVGYNFRMTDMQAAVGSVQLRKLNALNARRAAVARQLNEALSGVPGLVLPHVRPEAEHVWHLYPLQLLPEFGVGKEDFVCRMLHEHGIKIGTHYIPLHLTTAFQKRGGRKGQLPVAEGLYERLVTLPLHPRLTDVGVEHLVQSIRACATK